MKAGPEAGTAAMIELMSTDRIADMLDSFDSLKRGRMPRHRLCAGGEMTGADSTRAPPGGGTFYGVTFAPYALEDGGPARWDEIKAEEGEKSLAYFRRFYDRLDDANILAKVFKSPLDMERDSPNSFVKGDIHGCAPYVYQTVGHRPTPDFGHYTVPGVEKLYLVGPFMHPGGGVFGAGRATAIRMMDDMGIDYDKVMGARM